MLKKRFVSNADAYAEFFKLYGNNDIEEMKRQGYQEIKWDEQDRLMLGNKIVMVKERVELCAGIDLTGANIVYNGNIVYLFGDGMHVVWDGNDNGVCLYRNQKTGPWFAKLVQE